MGGCASGQTPTTEMEVDTKNLASGGLKRGNAAQ